MAMSEYVGRLRDQLSVDSFFDVNKLELIRSRILKVQSFIEVIRYSTFEQSINFVRHPIFVNRILELGLMVSFLTEVGY